MKTKKEHVDSVFLTIVLIILVFGLFMFGSAALGVLAKHEVKFYNVIINQFVFALAGGLLALFVGLFVHYSNLKKYSLYFYISTFILTLLVLVPGIGFAHGGARRWIHIGGFSIQPSEILKFGTIFFLASWLSVNKKRIDDMKYGLLPFALIVGIPFALLLTQPDTGTGSIIIFSCLAMYLVSGARWRDIAIIFLTGILTLGLLVAFRPYVKDRIMTFIDPSRDVTGSSYQLQQGLIAIGSGGLAGRGYGQSIQKFNFLPEPIGDSIFAVIGEEFGLLGSAFTILLFMILGIRGYKIANQTRDSFGMFIVIGITTLLLSQAFLNIASIVGLFPMKGIPLPFISHGGTALLTSLFGVGIILNVSKYRTLN